MNTIGSLVVALLLLAAVTACSSTETPRANYGSSRAGTRSSACTTRR